MKTGEHILVIHQHTCACDLQISGGKQVLMHVAYFIYVSLVPQAKSATVIN